MALEELRKEIIEIIGQDLIDELDEVISALEGNELIKDKVGFLKSLVLGLKNLRKDKIELFLELLGDALVNGDDEIFVRENVDITKADIWDKSNEYEQFVDIEKFVKWFNEYNS